MSSKRGVSDDDADDGGNGMETETRSQSDMDQNDDYDEEDEDELEMEGGSGEEDGDGSSDDDDDEENVELKEKKEKEFYEEKLAVLKETIEENANAYQCYLHIIELTRSSGDLNNLRVYREKMSEVFPLTEKLWLEWIEDELKFVDSSSDRQRIYDLFEKAVQDYLSVDLWVEYIQFSIRGLNEPNGMDRIRSICERAVATGGCHVRKGCILWEAYRELEGAILAGLRQSLCGSTESSKKIEDDIAKQIERIDELFKRQLRVPLDGMKDTFEEYKSFIVENDLKMSGLVIQAYETSLDKLKELTVFENELEELAGRPDKKLIVYKKYLEYESESRDSDESRLKCLFERVIADEEYCLNTEIWLLYSLFMFEKCKNSTEKIQFCRRGLRNWPTITKLWIHLALLLEQSHDTTENIKKVYNEGMNAGELQSADYLELWHAYIDFLRRQINFNEEQPDVLQESIESLRGTIQLAINQLFELYGHGGDPLLTLEKYWAYCEAKYFKSLENARKIWNEMIIQKNGLNKSAQEWIDFYQFELKYGDEKHQRKVLLRAMNEPYLNDKAAICELYSHFEKLNGNIDTWLAAKVRVESVMNKLEKDKEKEKEKQNAKQKPPQQQQPSKPQAKPKVDKKPKPKEKPERKQPSGSDQTLKRKKSEDEQAAPLKRAVKDSKKDKDGFAIPSLPTVNDMPPPSAKKPKSDDVAEQPSSKAESMNPDQDFIDRKNQISNTSVFLSNLSFDVTEIDIENALKSAIGLQAVRIVKHWSGKSKGFGYADFDTQANAIEALKLDRTPLNGRPLFISKCEDKSLSFGVNKFKYSNNLEKNKLFVSNLPFSTTKEQLEEIFKAFGNLKEVRIVTFKSGKSKGLAYVEFEDEASTSKAILQTDNMLIGEHQISVAISNPPKKAVKDSDEPNALTTSSLGSGTVKPSTSGTRAKGHMVTLMPRSVATKQTSANTKPNPATTKNVNVNETALQNIQLNDSEKNVKQMTNADFRSFLLKKD